MKIFILLFGIFLHTVSYSGVDYSLISSNDGSINVKRHTVTAHRGSYGIAKTITNYSTLLNHYRSDGLLLSIDTGRNQTRYTGQIGVGKKDNTQYLLGNMSVNYKLDQYITFKVEFFGDLVDSPKSLSSNITYNGLLYSAELDTGTFGIVGGIKQLKYSDYNIQRGMFSKLWSNITPGLNGYITIKEHSNSLQSIYYSSPPHYNRTGVGLSGSTLIKGIGIGGFIEHSIIRTDYHSEHTNTWQIRFNSKIKDNTRIILKLGRDYSLNTDFNYRYLNIQIMVNW